ncbi:MAG: protein-tyrosine-phosphatase [Saprospiraceae bacterium]|nr:protein-tyrosine-phosphatase [Saprospiraceae bacterium]MCF8250545.1 protein-tyrosine-phosphatase [Saprospiraceae bacterium]MCF8279685.1 hypothetical protein [Bacteroidales bacterium]MCF8312471.1 protein-tyrosine-phosphatase [Saprospiraceae bacterium]MCF8440712.1 protein-tyrosine-phosphatase [Saprospiraceae bacterium]
MENIKFYKKLQTYCETLENEADLISEERKKQLAELSDYIFEKKKAGEEVRLTVICTHNSRRSHMGQLWLQAAAAYYGIEGVVTASGGTEATAFNPRAVAALERAGFDIAKGGGEDNPQYEASYSSSSGKVLMFSKKHDDPFNPQSGFAAILVCSEADAACPIVSGAAARLAIPYEDPKHADGTPSEGQAYDDSCRQIAREMFYAVHFAKQKMETE